MKGKSKRTTILLMLITIFLFGAVIFIGRLILSGNGEESKVAPKKTKANSITYSKLIAFNTTPAELPPSLTPTSSIEEKETPVPTETQLTPTPTEIILAYKNPSLTGDATNGARLTTTISPTKVKGLPDAGSIYNGLIIFSVAGLLVFFSFLF